MTALADLAVPPRVLDPQSAPEAWNVIRLVSTNVEQLIKEDRLAEIPPQISLASPALRALVQHAPTGDARIALPALTARAAVSINAIATGGLAGNRASVERDFAAFRAAVEEAAKLFDAKHVAADISVCPMHPDCLSPDPATQCAKCGMHLVLRRIPYSFIYVQPGKPSITISARAKAPLQAGQQAQVEVQLKKSDGSPVLVDELMVMHTEPIHLLIVDPSLEDYHREHPRPTDTPGTYAFTFTPVKNTAYRIFADLVPVATAVQEYPFIDLPGAERGRGPSVAEDTFSATAGGLNFTLSFPGMLGKGPRARQIHNMLITVADADGRPVQRLEPVMNAFAHVVGFYDDYLTVVHLHPTGGDILRQDVRGGPGMGFKFFPPRPGFMRLYCQVLVDGKMIFALFNVNVLP